MKLLLTLSMIFILAFPLWSDILDDALVLEQEGDLLEARRLYLQWLEENPDDPRIADVLTHSVPLFPQVREAIAWLSQYVESLGIEESFPVYARMASLESMIGEPQKAAEHYRLAGKMGGEEGQRYLLQALILNVSMGEMDEVQKTARQLSQHGKSSLIREEAWALNLLVQALKGDVEASLVALVSRLEKDQKPASPLPWVFLNQLAISQNRRQLSLKVQERLEKDFPSSVASYLAKSRVFLWPLPTELFDRLPESPRAFLQVGAFRNKKSALAQRKKLEEEGFSVWLEEEQGLWRIIVNDYNGQTLAGLKEKGFPALVR